MIEYQYKNDIAPSISGGVDIFTIAMLSTLLSTTTRQGLYQIVTTRLEQIASSIEAVNPQGAVELRQASPHWLRPTFGKASLLAGHDIRNVAASMGHASLETTMTYTQQEALDLIQAYERANLGSVAMDNLA